MRDVGEVSTVEALMGVSENIFSVLHLLDGRHFATRSIIPDVLLHLLPSLFLLLIDLFESLPHFQLSFIIDIHLIN